MPSQDLSASRNRAESLASVNKTEHGRLQERWRREGGWGVKYLAPIAVVKGNVVKGNRCSEGTQEVNIVKL